MPSALDAAFSASTMRTLGHAWVDQLAEHLTAVHAPGSAVAVAPQPRGDVAWMAQWRARLHGAVADPLRLLRDIVDGSTHLHHPGCFGHQVSAPLPLAALCEGVSALLNNGMAVFEMGPVATAIEQAMVRWMTRHLGWSDAADGAFVSGGSLANLMGVLAARLMRAGFSVWREGAHAGPPLALLTSEQAHYCTGRAVRLVGWGDAGVIKVATDERFRLRPELLETCKAAAESSGRRVVAVVASACSTATGSYDPLEPIAAFCARHDLWLHVDGAHGASALLSPRYRDLVRGIERADSVSWDAHKLLMMPALATGILFRDGAVARELFAQEASYLYHEASDERHYDLGHRTIECTKRMMAMPLFVCLASYGEAMFAEHVTACFDKARDLAAHLRAQPDFELAVEPQANIVCFRHLPASLRDAPVAAQNRWQTEQRARVLAGGGSYLVQAQLGERVYLRTTILHPLTKNSHLEAMLDELRRSAP